jgi:hypothetical protein
VEDDLVEHRGFRRSSPIVLEFLFCLLPRVGRAIPAGSGARLLVVSEQGLLPGAGCRVVCPLNVGAQAIPSRPYTPVPLAATRSLPR